MREFDVIVFGATGFTGRLTTAYLAQHAPAGVRWAIAGRNPGKLEELATTLRASPRPPEGSLVADATRAEATLRVAQRGRVVVNAAGPPARCSEPLMRACLSASTDLIDLCAEPHMVERMVERYHPSARARGLKLIPACGFESVPHDLGVAFTLEQIPTEGPVTVEGFVRLRGGVSRGVWRSAMSACGDLRASTKAWREQRAAALPTGTQVRPVRPRLRYEREVGAWTCPLPTVDTQVVLRSARLLPGYGPDFRYGHYARVRRIPTLVAGAGAAGALVGFAQLPIPGALMAYCNPFGAGPDEAARARGWFRITFVARAGGRTYLTEVTGGDPAHGETAKIAGEASFCLALDREKTPAATGVLTPASGLGRPMIDRLISAGLRFRRLRPPPIVDAEPLLDAA